MTVSKALPLIQAELPSLFLSQEFADNYINNSNLEEAMDDWCGMDDIVSFHVSENHGCVRLVTQSEKKDCFHLIRMFPMGNKWQVSVDAKNLTAAQMMSNLLERL